MTSETTFSPSEALAADLNDFYADMGRTEAVADWWMLVAEDHAATDMAATMRHPAPDVVVCTDGHAVYYDARSGRWTRSDFGLYVRETDADQTDNWIMLAGGGRIAWGWDEIGEGIDWAVYWNGDTDPACQGYIPANAEGDMDYRDVLEDAARELQRPGRGPLDFSA